MIKVSLISHTDAEPLKLASHAASICYQSEMPEFGKLLDVENRLFKVGHHTTLQHFFLTFAIDGLAVGDITFGLHLASPFYNSDQRSGRYCSKMFVEPDFNRIEGYVKNYWPEVDDSSRAEIMDYIKQGVNIYQSNIAKAAEYAGKTLIEERPFITEKAVSLNAPKIAQEQMRSFISVIFPTALDFTINLTTLAALHESAWTPAMRAVTQKMVDATIAKFPQIAFMFDTKKPKSWAMVIPGSSQIGIKYKPNLRLFEIIEQENFIVPNHALMHPVDKLHFSPEMMDNSISEILAEIEISTATMGQDQRHRTLRRSQPKFTGDFYTPPLVKELNLENEAIKIMEKWIGISKKIPKTLAMVLAPYGSMVKYKKSGSFNAIAHEQAKRLCWCAQEEIYHIARLLRQAVEDQLGGNNEVVKMFEPLCYSTGICAEGARYCGRDINKRKTGDYFPERKV